MSSHTLDIPAASLYYELDGHGPIVAFISGDNGDAGLYSAVARALTSQYSTLIYDRRGFSRSTAEIDDRDNRLDQDVEDLHLLLRNVTDQPVYIFSSGSGAIVGLHFLTRYPNQVKKLIAHEPPLIPLLTNSRDLLAVLDDIHHTYQQQGEYTAMRQYNQQAGILTKPAPPRTLPAKEAATNARTNGNIAFFLTNEMRQYPRRVPDLKQLTALSSKIVLAGGAESADMFTYRPNVALARALNKHVVDFPGDHIGYAAHPLIFAHKLYAVLAP